MADVFIIPSHSETWGLAINEAMACSRPVITTINAGAAADLIVPEINGIVVKGNDTSEAISYINKLANDRNEWIKASQASRQLIQPYNFNAICSAIEQIF